MDLVILAISTPVEQIALAAITAFVIGGATFYQAGRLSTRLGKMETRTGILEVIVGGEDGKGGLVGKIDSTRRRQRKTEETCISHHGMVDPGSDGGSEISEGEQRMLAGLTKVFVSELAKRRRDLATEARPTEKESKG